MTIKELLEKYLIEEVEVSVPVYTTPDYNGGEIKIIGFHQSRIKQLNLSKLMDLLSKSVKIEDIVEKEEK